MSLLNLVPIYMGDRQALIQRLSNSIERTLHVTVRLRAPWFDPEIAFDASRCQHNSSQLLRQLLSDPFPDEARVLGVTSRDLFSPALTYVFGEAQLNGRAAIVSIDRLRNEAYGLPRNDMLLCQRSEKEAIHELGHMYGLVHCRSVACVMQASTFAEQIDFKSARFCTRCLEKLAPRKA